MRFQCFKVFVSNSSGLKCKFVPSGFGCESGNESGDMLDEQAFSLLCVPLSEREAKQKEKKDKDKKHKKDKKDKDKEEGKEKDKDQSKEKRKDKKEKKEKDRDKSQEKKNNLSDEKRIGTPREVNLQSNHFAEASCVQELAKRISDKDSATETKTVERNALTNQKQVGFSGRVVANAVDHSERKDISKDNSTYKKIIGAQKDSGESGVRKVAIVHSFGGVEQKRVDMVRPMEKDVKESVEKNEKERPNIGAFGRDDKRFNRQVEPSNGKNGFVQEFGDVGDEHALGKSQYVGKSTLSDQKRSRFIYETSISNGDGVVIKANGQSEKPRGHKLSFVHNLSRRDEQGKVEGIKRMADGKEKSKVEEVEITGNKGLVGKQTAKVVERIEGQQVREGREPNKRVFKIKEVVREVENGSKLCLSKESNKVTIPEGSAKKRKQPGVNGFLLDTEIRPTKLKRTPSSRRLLVKNGRNPDQPIPPNPPPIEKPNTIITKPQAKDHKINSITTLKLPKSLSQSIPSSTTTITSHTKINGFIDQSHSSVSSPKTEKIRKAPSIKPPRPDTKHLNQILTIPKLEEITEPETDDWLFNTKPRSSLITEESQEQHVWDKAIQIQYVDIYALPYVIPF